MRRRAWALAANQHGVISRRQLARLGFGDEAIKHRLRTGRLHRLHRGVYAVGRPRLTQRGRWMAAVLACGEGAVLSHGSAAALWAIRTPSAGAIEVSIPPGRDARPRGVRVHRPVALPDADVIRRDNIPVTRPTRTLLDLATRLDAAALERAVNEADRLHLTDPQAPRTALGERRGERGVGALRELLARQTFTLTDSELERAFLPIAGAAGLPPPRTQARVNGYRVDFFWPELGLVVETDGLRYHRTPAQQARDRLRDQAHAAAGLTPLRFTHAQVRYEPDRVREVLAEVARGLAGARGALPAPSEATA